tara:strand:- start:163 stop:522 length:360 start_codon:yes stop_codon:yes gene_type:complete
MAVTLTFNSPINMSCKIDDAAYYTPDPASSGGFEVDNGIFLIGTITSITDNGTTVTIVCNDTGPYASNVNQNDFIFFAKNNTVELKKIKGYYAEVEYRNNSKKPAELFATACGVVTSSK